MPPSLPPRLVPVDYDPFRGPPLAAVLPLTDAQRDLWLAAALDPVANLACHEGVRLSLDGRLDAPALEASLQAVVDRHEALRGTVGPAGDRLGVRASLELALPVTDLTPEVYPQAAADATERDLMGQAFALDTGPLVRAALLKLGENRHRLILIVHRVVCDGWSLGTLLGELAELYSARVEGRAPALHPAPRFGDYALAAQATRDSATGQQSLAYWLKRLAGAPAALDLPPDLTRPARRGGASARCDHALPTSLVARLRAVGPPAGAGFVATLLASFAALLHRLSGATDMVLGLHASGQARHHQPTLVGHAVDLLLLRLHPDPDQTYRALLADTQGQLLDALDHQGPAFGTLLSRLKPGRDPARPPLVSVVFDIDTHRAAPPLAGLKVAREALPRQGTACDLAVTVVDGGQEVRFECTYDTTLYTRDGLKARLQEWQALLECVAGQPDTRLGDLPLLSAAERRRIVHDFNDTTRSLPTAVPAIRHVERYAAETPEAIALRASGETWTYARLGLAASKLARWLTDAGVGKGHIVGICAERGAGLVMAWLAVQKAGAAWLPLAPTDPAERLAFMVRDAGCPVVLTAVRQMPDDLETWFKAPEQGIRLLDLLGEYDAAVARLPDVSHRVEPKPTDLAACLYVSGATGRPRGVLLENAGLANRLLWMQERYTLTAADTLLQQAPCASEAAVWEILWPLMQGASLLIPAPDAPQDAPALAALIAARGVTVCHFFAPDRLAAFLAQPEAVGCTTLREVFCSGGGLPAELARRFSRVLPTARLHTLYGPIEAGGDVAAWDAPPERELGPGATPPLGRPVANTRLYVLNPVGEPVPVGVAGELHVAGLQLARGYLHQPALTLERFVTHPEFGRLYRTGDTVRWRADGAVEFLGRRDGQVRRHGFRIELGEIEAVAARHPAVREAAAGIVEGAAGDSHLVLWYAPRPGMAATAAEVEADARPGVPAGELRAFLHQSLPESMVPQHMVALDALPHRASGIDRPALPAPLIDGAARLRTPPATPAEAAVARVWRDLLKPTPRDICREDRFGDLGGHSLQAVQVAARLRDALGTRVPLRVAMTEPLAVIAAAAGPPGVANGASEPAADLPPLTPTDPPPTLGPNDSPPKSAPPRGRGGLLGRLGELFSR